LRKPGRKEVEKDFIRPSALRLEVPSLPLLLLLLVVVLIAVLLPTLPREAAGVVLLVGEEGRERLSCRLARLVFMVVLLGGGEKKRNGGRDEKREGGRKEGG